MISYPPPKFEEQKSEILQRYQILYDDHALSAQSFADSVALTLNVPFVMAALKSGRGVPEIVEFITREGGL